MDTIEFIAPFALEQCRHRLESRHEGFTLLAWRWQTRKHIEVKPLDSATYQFSIKKVGKSALVGWGGSAHVKGYLRAQSPTSTAVIAEADISWGMLIFSAVLVTVLEGVLIWGWMTDKVLSSAQLPMAILIALLVNGGLMTWIYIQSMLDKRNLIHLLQVSLGKQVG